MIYDFDRPVDRRISDSTKWSSVPPDVLPLPIADMDFLAPEPVRRALQERVEHGVFGYGVEPPSLRGLVCRHLEQGHGWRVSPEAIVFLPGVISGFNLVVRARLHLGRGVLTQPPVYPPVLGAAGEAGLPALSVPLSLDSDGRYGVDLDGFAEEVARTRPGVFILCNPHNPVGRVFSREELAGMAAVCLRHDVLICSDEIHCDLVYPGHDHLPVAALDPEVGRRTVTLMAPSKTYNIAGLNCAYAVIEDLDLRRRFVEAGRGLVGGVSIMGYTAAVAAYAEGQEWLDQVLAYLRGNRDYLSRFVREELPGIGMSEVEGTFLAWLDCRRAGIAGDPAKFFLEQARVCLGDGRAFGREGEGFVRLNFACTRSTLAEALERMRAALEAVGAGGQEWTGVDGQP